LNPINSESHDQQLSDILQNLDFENMQYDMLKDRTHPADKNRTLLKEAQTTLETYLARKKKQTGFDMFDIGDVGSIRRKLRDEYLPKPVKPKEEDEAEGGDTKAEEKFEPFYQGEDRSSEGPSSDNATEATPEPTQAPARQERRRDRDGKKEQRENS